MERHEDSTDEVADREPEQCPAEGQGEGRCRQAARDNGQEHEIRAEPDREQIRRGAVALAERDRLDGAAFEPARFGFVHLRIMLEGAWHWNAAAQAPVRATRGPGGGTA